MLPLRAMVYSSCFVMTAAGAAGQVWTESLDARSFPDAAAQVTRGGGELTSIVGATSYGDPRDAYCLKVVDPASFRATTDPHFDSRLFLFDGHGAPVLANDDASSSGPAFSTPSGAATDGSGRVLNRPGEYMLVVAGSDQSPRDSTGRDLFAIGAGRGSTHAPDPRAGRFDRWEGGAAETGSYRVVLTGATFCQGPDALDVVLSKGGEERICLGDGSGGFQACGNVGVDATGADIAAGFVDGDAHLDVVFSGSGSSTGSGAMGVSCLGNGAGGFSVCQDVFSGDESSTGVALGFVDGDANLDVVFSRDGFGGLSNNRVCLGDGSGDFPSCSDVSDDGDRTADVALGYLDADLDLDAVFANSGPQGQRNRVCLGNGDGTFQPCADISADSRQSTNVALGLLDGDSNLDVVFANSHPSNGGDENRVCLGNGDGTFGPCADVPAEGTPKDTTAVALGFLNADSFLDAVFSNTDNARNRVCLGDGNGSFIPCTNLPEPLGRTGDIELGFVDGDQHLDLVFVDGWNDLNRVCLGNGDGTFQPCDDIGFLEQGSGRVLLGEFGDPNIFADGFESGDTSAWAATVP